MPLVSEARSEGAAVLVLVVGAGLGPSGLVSVVGWFDSSPVVKVGRSLGTADGTAEGVALTVGTSVEAAVGEEASSSSELSIVGTGLLLGRSEGSTLGSSELDSVTDGAAVISRIGSSLGWVDGLEESAALVVGSVVSVMVRDGVEVPMIEGCPDGE